MVKTPDLVEFLRLQAELARVQERFSVFQSAAEDCCKGARQAKELADKLEPVNIPDPALRTHFEGLRKTAQQLGDFERTLSARVKELHKPLQQLEALGLKRE